MAESPAQESLEVKAHRLQSSSTNAQIDVLRGHLARLETEGMMHHLSR